MKFIADTHLHIYPVQDAASALTTLMTRLNRLSPEAHAVACLTERVDCDVFSQLSENPPGSVEARFSIEAEQGSLLISDKAAPEAKLCLLPGQQIITKHKLEVLALNMSARVEEGLEEAETIQRVLQLGGIPVVAWSPGKWFGRRGKIVRSLLDIFSPNQLALGDTTLRAGIWPTPFIMREAKHRGFQILCGSDPLPFPGEETRCGTYASLICCDEGAKSASKAFQNLLNSGAQIHPIGQRGSIFVVAGRIFKNELIRRDFAPKTWKST